MFVEAFKCLKTFESEHVWKGENTCSFFFLLFLKIKNLARNVDHSQFNQSNPTLSWFTIHVWLNQTFRECECPYGTYGSFYEVASSSFISSSKIVQIDAQSSLGLMHVYLGIKFMGTIGHFSVTKYILSWGYATLITLEWQWNHAHPRTAYHIIIIWHLFGKFKESLMPCSWHFQCFSLIGFSLKEMRLKKML